MAPLRFGPFDFDGDTPKSSRDNAAVRLQSQSAQVLAAWMVKTERLGREQ
jgi:hypothetical protein